MNEVWKDISILAGYEVSNLGRVRSLDRIVIDKNGVKKPYKGRILNLSTDHRGYKFITVHCNHKRKIYKVYHLVYEAFIGPIKKGMDIDHIDRNTSNNNVENLRLVNRRDNNLNRCNVKHYSGITQSKRAYQIAIYYNGKNCYLGTEKDAEKAYQVYQMAKQAIESGTFDDFYQSRRFKKNKDLPKCIFYNTKRQLYSAAVKGKHIAQSKDLEYVQAKLNEYLRNNG